MKQKIPDDSIDLVVTSPPYNIGIDYGHGWDSDALTTQEYKSFTKKWIEEIFRVIKDDGRFCLNIGYRVCTVKDSGIDYPELINIVKDIGFKLRETIVWIKTREIGNPQSFCGANTAWGSWLSASNPICRSYFEFIFVFYKKYLGKKNKGESTMTKKEFLDYTQNAWFFPTEIDRTHPAPFPLELPLRCIKFFSYKGDIVLDPFMGSGTTAEACIRLNRQYIGFEISKSYCNAMKCRTEQERLSADTFTQNPSDFGSQEANSFNKGLKVSLSATPKLSPTGITSPNHNIKSNSDMGSQQGLTLWKLGETKK